MEHFLTGQTHTKPVTQGQKKLFSGGEKIWEIVFKILFEANKLICHCIWSRVGTALKWNKTNIL